jgi:hypothetical protein
LRDLRDAQRGQQHDRRRDRHDDSSHLKPPSTIR